MYVTTTFIPATNTRPERIKATLHRSHAADVSVTVPWNNEITFSANHEFAFNEVLREANHGNDTFTVAQTSDGFIYVSTYLTVEYIRSEAVPFDWVASQNA